VSSPSSDLLIADSATTWFGSVSGSLRMLRQRIRNVRAADLQEWMAEQRFSVPPDPTKTAAIPEHRGERSEQSDSAGCASSKAQTRAY